MTIVYIDDIQVGCRIGHLGAINRTYLDEEKDEFIYVDLGKGLKICDGIFNSDEIKELMDSKASDLLNVSILSEEFEFEFVGRLLFLESNEPYNGFSTGEIIIGSTDSTFEFFTETHFLRG